MAERSGIFRPCNFREGYLCGSEGDRSIIEMEKTYECDWNSFLGLAGYYRRFIERFSMIASPMTRITRKEFKFEWSKEYEAHFQELKSRLTSAWLVLKSAFLSRFYIVKPGEKNKGCLDFKLTTWEIKVKKFMHMVK